MAGGGGRLLLNSCCTAELAFGVLMVRMSGVSSLLWEKQPIYYIDHYLSKQISKIIFDNPPIHASPLGGLWPVLLTCIIVIRKACAPAGVTLID
jgi:hypothetical protein